MLRLHKLSIFIFLIIHVHAMNAMFSRIRNYCYKKQDILLTQDQKNENLMLAAKQGNIINIEHWLSCGADINGSDGIACPLTEAVAYANEATVKTLLDHNADVNARAKLANKISAVWYALNTKQSAPILRLLLIHDAILDEQLMNDWHKQFTYNPDFHTTEFHGLLKQYSPVNRMPSILFNCTIHFPFKVSSIISEYAVVQWARPTNENVHIPKNMILREGKFKRFHGLRIDVKKNRKERAERD